MNLMIPLVFLINNAIPFICGDEGEGELNFICNSDKECRYFGYVCKQNTCQCDQWYIPNKESKMCVGGVDQKCLYDEHCIEGAYCMNQVICKCKHDRSQVLHQGFVCAGNSQTSQIKSAFLFLMAIAASLTVV
ncbi:hypothetical protein FQR65_LT09002 [Abscondita terminalis]|nr:hypothetical protein FQR65_LT09002 [Abscondita terminalis]